MLPYYFIPHLSYHIRPANLAVIAVRPHVLEAKELKLPALGDVQGRIQARAT
jgi:hypothetical protein